MKAKNIVDEIAGSSEYYKLVEFLSSENGDNKHLPSEILEIVQVLGERIDNEKKSFLLSSFNFGLKPRLDSNTIIFKVPHNVQAAKDEFDKELNKQMPAFIHLMNLIPAEDLIPEPIAV